MATFGPWKNLSLNPKNLMNGRGYELHLTRWQVVAAQAEPLPRATWHDNEKGLKKMKTSIYGHTAKVEILISHGMGVYDVEVVACESMPSMVGMCYRVCGLAFGIEE